MGWPIGATLAYRVLSVQHVRPACAAEPTAEGARRAGERASGGGGRAASAPVRAALRSHLCSPLNGPFSGRPLLPVHAHSARPQRESSVADTHAHTRHTVWYVCSTLPKRRGSSSVHLRLRSASWPERRAFFRPARGCVWSEARCPWIAHTLPVRMERSATAGA